jgi:hypothetical protein
MEYGVLYLGSLGGYVWMDGMGAFLLKDPRAQINPLETAALGFIGCRCGVPAGGWNSLPNRFGPVAGLGSDSASNIICMPSISMDGH